MRSTVAFIGMASVALAAAAVAASSPERVASAAGPLLESPAPLAAQRGVPQGRQGPRGISPRGILGGPRGRGLAARGGLDRIQAREYLFPETDETIEYALFVSRKVDRRTPAPLVIALHGAGVPPAHPRSLAVRSLHLDTVADHPEFALIEARHPAFLERLHPSTALQRVRCVHD